MTEKATTRKGANPIVIAALIAAVGGIIGIMIQQGTFTTLINLIRGDGSPITKRIDFNNGNPLAEFEIMTISQSNPNNYSITFSGFWGHKLLGCQNETGVTSGPATLPNSIIIHLVVISLTDGSRTEQDYFGQPIKITRKGVKVICYPTDPNSIGHRPDHRIPAADIFPCPGHPPQDFMSVTYKIVH